MLSKTQVFLEISQNSQENTSVRVSILIKLQALEHLWWTASVALRNISLTCSTLSESHFYRLFQKHRPQMFFKIGVLKNITMSTKKHLRWSFLLINLGLMPKAKTGTTKSKHSHEAQLSLNSSRRQLWIFGILHTPSLLGKLLLDTRPTLFNKNKGPFKRYYL